MEEESHAGQICEEKSAEPAHHYCGLRQGRPYADRAAGARRTRYHHCGYERARCARHDGNVRRDGHSRQRREPERVDGRRASGGRPGDRGHGFGRAEPALLHNRQKGRRRAGGDCARAQPGLQRGAAVSASAARIIHDYQSGAGGRAGNRASAFPSAGADGQLVCQGARRAGAFQDSERKHPARASRHAAG